MAFLALLIVFLACGYDFKATRAKESAPVERVEPTDAVAEDEQESVLEADEGEEQRQEAYTELEEDGFDTIFSEEESDAEEEIFDDETANEEDSEETTAVEPIVLQTQTSTVSTVEEPALADGTRPYKVVEKVVTETVTETYTETPPPTEQKTGGLSDAVVEKLVDLLDYEIRTRREQEQKAAETVEAKKNEGGSIPTFARMDDEDDEDEDEEDEE